MSKKLDFSIAVKLAAENFQKGIKNIQSQLGKFKKLAVNAFAGFSALQFGRDMIQAGAQFQDAMARVQAISKASTNDLKALREEAMRLGRDTKYTATEAATALEQLIRNGLKPVAAKEALGGVLQLAQSQAISLAEAADIATTSMNAFGLSTKDLTRINDVLAATASNTATNVLELFEAFKIAAPIAKSAGVSLEETATALGSLANQGFRGSEAGTGLKQIILAIADKTPDAIKVAQKYGIQLDEVSLRSEGLIKTLERMKKAAMGFSIQDLSQFANKLGAPKMAAVLGSDMSELYQAVANSQGEAARMFEEGLGEFEKAQKTLISVYENTQIKVFDSFKNLFTQPLNILAEFIRRIQDVPTVMVGAVGLALSKIGGLFQKTQVKLKSFAEQEYTKELNKRGDAYQNAAIAQSITNINSGVDKSTANYYRNLHQELGQVATQFDLSTKNGKVYQKLMNDLSYITNASTTNTQKYKRAIANVADTLATMNRQTQGVNVNVLRTAYVDFERDKSKIVASASNFQSTMTSVFGKIGTAAKTVGRSIYSFFGGWIGLALTLVSVVGTSLVSAWRKSTEAVRNANKLMNEATTNNNKLETSFLQLVSILREHESSSYAWQAAMSKLKREYPELLEKLHLEKISVNQSAEEYDKLANRIKDVIKWQKQYNTFKAKNDAVEELNKSFFEKNAVFKEWMKKVQIMYKENGLIPEVAEIKQNDFKNNVTNILLGNKNDSIKKQELIKLFQDAFKEGRDSTYLNATAQRFANLTIAHYNAKAGLKIKELNRNFPENEPVKDKLTSDIDKYLSDKEGELNLAIANVRKEGTAKGWGDEEIKQKINTLAKDLIDEIYKELDGQTYTDKKGDKRNSLEYAQTTGSYQFIKNQSIANIPKPDKKAEQRENSIADAEKRYAINLDYYSKELSLNLIDEKKFHEKKLSALQSLISSYEFNGDASKLETAKYKDLIKTREELIKTLKKENDDEERAKELNRYNREASSRAAWLKKSYDNTMSGAGREKINKWDFLSFDAKEDKSSQVTLNYLKAQLDKLKQVRSNVTEDDIARAKELKTEGSNELLNQVKLLDNAIQMLGSHVVSLEDKFQLKQAQEAIKELDKEVRRGTYEGIKQTVSVSNQLIDTIKGFENFDEMSGWEQFQYIVDSIFTTIDAMLELTEMWERLDKLMNNFATATQSLSSIETNAAQQRIAATQAEANAVVSAEATKAAAKTQSSAQSIAADTAEAAVEKTTATANVAANTAEAASSAGKSAAKLPFPFNLLAIGGAIAGVLALFSAIPKFASGGVVGGSKFNGDQNLARVNAGEAILTKNQQSRLFRLLNGGGSSTINNGNVEFKIKGSELIGVLKNYNGKMNKV
jgi:TP901 family phage tail tape measure protein